MGVTTKIWCSIAIVLACVAGVVWVSHDVESWLAILGLGAIVSGLALGVFWGWLWSSPKVGGWSAAAATSVAFGLLFGFSSLVWSVVGGRSITFENISQIVFAATIIGMVPLVVGGPGVMLYRVWQKTSKPLRRLFYRDTNQKQHKK